MLSLSIVIALLLFASMTPTTNGWIKCYATRVMSSNGLEKDISVWLDCNEQGEGVSERFPKSKPARDACIRVTEPGDVSPQDVWYSCMNEEQYCKGNMNKCFQPDDNDKTEHCCCNSDKCNHPSNIKASFPDAKEVVDARPMPERTIYPCLTGREELLPADQIDNIASDFCFLSKTTEANINTPMACSVQYRPVQDKDHRAQMHGLSKTTYSCVAADYGCKNQMNTCKSLYADKDEPDQEVITCCCNTALCNTPENVKKWMPERAEAPAKKENGAEGIEEDPKHQVKSTDDDENDGNNTSEKSNSTDTNDTDTEEKNEVSEKNKEKEKNNYDDKDNDKDKSSATSPSHSSMVILLVLLLTPLTAVPLFRFPSAARPFLV